MNLYCANPDRSLLKSAVGATMVDGHFESKHFLTSKLSNCDGMIRIMHVLNGNVGVDIILPSKNQSAELSNKLGLNVANVE